MRLICFPYAGAGASIFKSWHLALPEDVEIYGIQLPGRQNRIFEPPFRRLAALTAEIGPQLMPLLDRPVAFFGHSMGAILVFELTRWLRRNGSLLPRVLFVSGRRAPQVPDSGPVRHLMSEKDFIAEIRNLNATPEEILENFDLLQLILPALRADTELCETYTYVEEPPLPCPIVAFAGADDVDETAERMEGWRNQTMGSFSLHLLPGDHFFINGSQNKLLYTVLDNLRSTHCL